MTSTHAPAGEYTRASISYRWDQYIPKSAIRVSWTDDSVRYLHPTKGWRRISNRRLGLG